MTAAISRDLQSRVAATEKLAARLQVSHTPSSRKQSIDSFTELISFQPLSWIDPSVILSGLSLDDTGDHSKRVRALAGFRGLFKAVEKARDTQARYDN